MSLIIPGSRLFKLALKEKKINEDIWGDVAKNNDPIPVYIPNGLRIEDLKKMQKVAFLTFYFRPSKLLQELINIKNVDEFMFKFKLVFKLLKYLKKGEDIPE